MSDAPSLFFFYDRPFDEPFLRAFLRELDEWPEYGLEFYGEPSSPEEFAAAAGDPSPNVGIVGGEYGDARPGFHVRQSHEHPRLPDLPHLEASVEPPGRGPDAEGIEAFAEDVLAATKGLYERSIAAGRRPLQAVGTVSNYLAADHPPFTTESLLGEVLLEVQWIHVLPPSVVEHLGRGTVEAAPARRVESLDDGSVALVASEDPRYPGSLAEVRDHLGVPKYAPADWDENRRSEWAQRLEATDPRDRLLAVDVLKRNGVGDPLADRLDDPDPYVRGEVVRALGETGDDPTESLERASADEYAGARRNALWALLAVDPDADRTRETVVAGTRDPSARVRYAAVEALSELKSGDTEVLAARLHDPDARVRWLARTELRTMETDGIDALAAFAAGNGRVAWRREAVAALGRAESDRAREALRELTDDPDVGRAAETALE